MKPTTQPFMASDAISLLRKPATRRRTFGIAMAGSALLLGFASFIEDPAENGWVIAQQWLFELFIVSVGLLIVLKRPGHPIGFIISWIGLAFAMMGAGQGLTRVAFESGELEEALLWAQLEGVGWIIFVLTLVNLLPLWFPNGKPTSRSGAVLARVAMIAAAIAIVGTVFSDRTCVSWPVGGIGDDCLAWLDTPWGFLDELVSETIGQGFLLITGLLSIVNLGYRFLKSRGIERQQLKWLTFGFALFLAALSASLLFHLNVDLLIWPALALVPGSIGVAVLRYRLFEIDRIISRTVAYALVVALLGGIFFGLVTTLTTFLSPDDPLVIAVATLAVAALFNPLRKTIQKTVDRRFNRSHYDAERVIEEFTGSLRNEVDADVLVDGWVGAVSDTMQPTAIRVWVREG